MKIRRPGDHHEELELQMTPMIDIVFQLLVFFIVTFKIVAQEGDFSIKMPLAGPTEAMPLDPQQPLRLRITADQDGELTSLSLNSQDFDSFATLHEYVIDLIGNDRGPGSIQETAEIELDCDEQLHYRYVIDAITAVSGLITEDRQIVTLIEKIKFAPPRS